MGKGKGERAPATTLVSYMPTQGYVFYNTHGRYHPTYTVNTTGYRIAGVPGSSLHLAVSVDNEAALAWLEDALAYAFMQRRPELWAYLEAVMDEVLFDMELKARL
jgi:hypothetical protein